MDDRTCPVCGVLFSQARPHGKPQKYCTKSCYTIAANLRAKARSALKPRKGPLVRPCAACGSPVSSASHSGVDSWCNTGACRAERRRVLQRRYQTPEVAHASYLRHKHKWRVYNARRQVRLNVQTVPGACTEAKIEARMDYFGRTCWVCGAPGTERDHVKPLSKHGLHVPANMRPICRFCNRSKKDTWPVSLTVHRSTP